MIRISDGKKELVVSSGAYQSMYKELGYKPLEAPSQEKDQVPDKLPQPDTSGPTEGPEAPSRSQINHMNTHQLMECAEYMGIDTSGVEDKAELKELILQYIK